MGVLRARTAGGIGLALMLTACGLQPYQNPNHREEGAGPGIFTGPEGEWVIFRRGEREKQQGENEQRSKSEDTEAAGK